MASVTDISIVIPCYNECSRLPVAEYSSFTANNPTVLLCFVNDGSTDSTLELLQHLKTNHPETIDIVSYKKNRGKAEATRRGIRYCTQMYKHSCIAYLDADLSTSLQECLKLSGCMKGNIEFCFGSRFLRVGSVIERKMSRFLIGRVIATCISTMLDLKVYDTQCGCKIFTRSIAADLFEEPFVSTWLFDVELIFRFLAKDKREIMIKKMLEIPLTSWIDRGKSKVGYAYAFKIWLDFYRIQKHYKKKGNSFFRT